jgi:O-antigen ligase
MRLDVVQTGAQRLARYAAIALGASLPLSTALDNVLLVLLLLCWLASGRYGEKLASIRANPVAVAALVLFAFVLAGLAWGTGPLAEGRLYAKKYSDLIAIALLVTVFIDPADRQRALFALAGSLALTLVLSFALWQGWLVHGGVVIGTPDDPSVFKQRIPHNVLMAFGLLLYVVLARQARDRVWQIVWIALAVAAAVNCVLMVRGRTGYVLIVVFALLVIFSMRQWKTVVAAAVLTAVGLAGAYHFSTGLQQRVAQTVAEARDWKPGVATTTSIGGRLEFYHNTIAIIAEHPILGVGTGGFRGAYAAHVKGSDMGETHNPHNLYLLVTVQLGLIGLALLAFLLIQQWRYAARLTVPDHTLLARAVVLILAVGGLFNSMIIDHTESLFFAWCSGLLFAELADAKRERASTA